jgi:hypothetical protein
LGPGLRPGGGVDFAPAPVHQRHIAFTTLSNTNIIRHLIHFPMLVFQKHRYDDV